MTGLPCERPGCTKPTVEDRRYCSSICLNADQDFDSPPVTVLARNKAGGVGRGLAWGVRQPVHMPPAP